MNHNASNTSNKTCSENERRVDHLINLVEKETRTERHLEQNSDISNPENIQHAKEVQKNREKEINNLKNILVSGEQEHRKDQLNSMK